MSNLPFKLLNKSSFRLQLNANMKQFSVLSALLTHHAVPFTTQSNENDLDSNVVNLSFGSNCKFSDVYLLAYIFKDYGLEYVQPTKRLDVNIEHGPNLPEPNFQEGPNIVEALTIDSFLKIDPKLDTQFVIVQYFKERFSPLSLDEQEENDSFVDDIDWERETFDAMTDGQLGSYDDFNGNIDDIMIWAGRD